MRKYAVVLMVLMVALIAASFITEPGTKTVVRTRTVTRQVGAQTLYIRNLSRFISDREIRESIPVWQRAVNRDFAGFWQSTAYRLVFLGRKEAPEGAMTAVFVNKGPVKGALAFHSTDGNAPAITVYAGTGAYYGYSNSVSFTHELFELAADPVTSYVNEGWPSDYFWIEKPSGKVLGGYQSAVFGWFNEVADPVEADSYIRTGLNGRKVRVSDFVTPAWFNDGVGSRFDFMGLCRQPFWIRPGGYGQFLDAQGWHAIFNFREGVESDRGFYLADPR